MSIMPSDGGTPAGGDGPGVDSLLFELLESDSDLGEALEGLCRLHPDLAEPLRARVRALSSAGLMKPERPSESKEMLLPDRLGDFQLLERLGAGGMGVVYRARQESLGREVALKIVRPELMLFEGVRERFRREVEIVARMSHPGIVPVYAVGEEHGISFFAMELVHGASLSQALDACSGSALEDLVGADLARAVARRAGAEPGLEPNLPPLFQGDWESTCLRIAREVAEALEHAHRRGVIHRDIKPSNVMLTPEGRVMLLDFGVARMEGVSDLTQTSQVGSMPYLPPEVLVGGPQDARTDVYALGVTLYETLCLRRPFEGKTPLALMRSIEAGPPARIRRSHLRASWEAETICQVSLDPDPQRRYPSASELALDLHNALEHRPISARRPGRWLRLKRWGQREPARAVALALGIPLVVVAPSLFAWQQYRAGQDLQAKGRELAKSNEELDAALGELGITNERLRASIQEARTQASIAEATRDFLNDDLLAQAAPRRMGKDVTVRAALDAAALRIADRFPDQPRVEAEVRNTLGDTYRRLGRFEEAEEQLGIAREKLEALGGERESVPYFETLHRLGMLRYDQTRYREAREFYRQALAGRRRLLGEADDDTLATRNNLGTTLMQLGVLDEAEAIHREILRIREDSLSEEHQDTIDSMNNLLAVLSMQGRDQEALELGRRAYEICERVIGPDRPRTLTTLHNLAALEAFCGNADEAEEAFLYVLEQQDLQLGPTHHETLNVLTSLAQFYGARGRTEEADALLDEAFLRLEDSGLEESSSYVGLLHYRRGEVRAAADDPAGAEEQFALAYAGYLPQLGERHPNTLSSRLKRARALAGLDRYEEAESELLELLGRDGRGVDDVFQTPEILSWTLLLTLCQLQLQHLDEAQATLELAAERLELAASRPDLRQWALQLADRLCKVSGRPEDLPGWKQKLAER